MGRYLLETKRFDYKHSKLLEIDCYVDADEVGLLSYEDI